MMYRCLKTEGCIHEHPGMDHQLSDSMIRHIHSTLHAALKDAVQAHAIPRNPKLPDSLGVLFLPIIPARSTMPVTVWSVFAIALHYSGLLR